MDNFLKGLGGLKAAPLATNLSGTWVKDKQRSDSMEAAMKLMGLGSVMRTAVRLIRGMELTHNHNVFDMAIFSGVPWFKVRERYPMDGATVKCRRRDFRRGGHKGSVSSKGDAVVLALQWGDPYAGHGNDRFALAAPDVLHVDSTVCNTENFCELYTTVYTRKK